MDMFQAIFLALIQGLTEFLPISSSAHLILPAQILQWPDQGLAFDVAVHVGTLSAVLLYFRKDITDMVTGFFSAMYTRRWNDQAKLSCAVIVGTIPAVIAGLIINDYAEQYLRSVWVIAIASIVFGLLLLWADQQHQRNTVNSKITVQVAESLSLKHAVIVGLMQVLAFIPGTSRSGITMTAGLMLGFTRQVAARFSFLLSIPLILASGLLKGLELTQSAEPVAWSLIATGVTVAAISAYLCIHLFLQLLDRIGMLPFVIYRVVLGVLLIAWSVMFVL